MAHIVRQPNHRRRVDYVFVGSWPAHSEARCTIQAAKTTFDEPIDGVWASDHFGVMVDLELARDAASA